MAISWSRVITAGLVAGILFLVMEMLLVIFALGGSPWGPPRMMAAMVLGNNVLPPPAIFDLGIMLVGLIIHIVLSIIYAAIIAFIIKSMKMGVAIAVGSLIGLSLYFINFYGFTSIFEWFAMARNWVSIISHIVFGAVAAWSYRCRPTPEAV